MDLELGFKVSRSRDDLTSDIRITKDSAGPVFMSTETETTFVLTAHLKGFKRERINIVVNEEGNKIAVSGEKPIQEMVMLEWTMYKKEAEFRGFRKVFWIPDSVIVDRIKAKFNEEDSILTIVMPKKTGGIQGTQIEEVKKEHFDGETSKKDDNVQEEPKPEESTQLILPELKEPEESTQLILPELKEPDPDPEIVSPQTPAQEIEDHVLDVAEETVKEEEPPKIEPKKSYCDRSTQTERWYSQEKSPKVEVEPKKSFCDRSTQTEKWRSPKEESRKAVPKKSVCDRSTQTEKWKSRKPPVCPSLFAGSFLVSLIGLVIQLLRNKKKR